MIDLVYMKVTTSSGGEGSYTTPVVVDGKVLGFAVDCTDVGNATADITVTDELGQVLLNATNVSNAAVQTYYPKIQAHENVTPGAIAGEYSHYFVHGKLTLTVAQGGDSKVITVTAILQR